MLVNFILENYYDVDIFLEEIHSARSVSYKLNTLQWKQNYIYEHLSTRPLKITIKYYFRLILYKIFKNSSSSQLS